MNTILYGIGERTKLYMEEHPEEKIFGILDGYRTEGEYCGIPIISLEMLCQGDAEIIIAARKASEKIIYERIKDFCKKFEIPIYNTNRVRIDGKCEKVVPVDPYYEKQSEDLIECIDKYDVISFDLFDTLLVREVGGVENVFRMVENKLFRGKDFAQERIRAEIQLSQVKVPKIQEIYERISRNTGICNEEWSVALNREIEIEKEILIPRKEMVNIFGEAIKRHKDVYIISDMYLSKEIIKEILCKNGIIGYKELYVSCEYGVDKANGLFGRYLADVNPGSCLHIGDSEIKDGKCAVKYGISSYLIKSPEDMAKITGAADLFTVPSGFLQGVSIAKLFENPFCLYQCNGKLALWEPYQIGYCIIAPVLYAFSLWLNRKMEENGMEALYFFARDGFLVKKVFDEIAEGRFFTEYLLISRTLIMRANADTWDAIEAMSRMSFDGTMQDMLQKRFGLKKEEIMPYKKGMTEEAFLYQHKDIIIRKAKQAKTGYRKYLSRFPFNERTAVFDFVSTGTCQMGLEGITGIKLQGFYFENLKSKSESMSVQKSSLQIGDFVNEVIQESCENYFLLETLLKETGPSLKGIDEKGNMLFGEMRLNEKQRETINGIQKGALDYVLRVKKLGFPQGDFYEEARQAFRLLKLMDKEYIQFRNVCMAENFDEFSNRIVETGLNAMSGAEML